MVHSTKQQLEEHKEKVPEDLKTKIEDELKKVEEAAKSDSVETINAAMEQFSKVAQEMGKHLYSQPTEGAPGAPGGDPTAAAGGPAPQGDAGNEDVIDADYEVKS
jgi:molecular chaperone DnaK